jgi:hypothetical protein
VPIHYRQEVADLFVYQPYLRRVRSIVAIRLNEISESLACAIQAVDHATELKLHGLATKSVDVHVIPDGSAVRTNVRQCALRKLESISNGGSYARHVLTASLSVPRTHHSSPRSRNVNVECILVGHQFVVVRERAEDVKVSENAFHVGLHSSVFFIK